MDGGSPHFPALVAERLAKTYRTARGTIAALADVSLEVPAGAVVALVGPNGAGKSTLLRVAAGVVRPDGGCVRVMGLRDPARAWRAASLGAMLDGAASLYPRLTVRENVEYFAALKGLPARQARSRAARALEAFGLAPRSAELFQKLSRGLRQRVAIACHTVHEPPVLLLDEPTLGADGECRAAVVELLAALRGRGTAILLATHDPELVAQLAARAAFMRMGAIEAMHG